MWTPSADQAEYYSIPSPSDLASTVGELLVPAFGPGADPTFGRAALPRSPDELKIRAFYKTRDGQISLDGGKGQQFVAYQVWEPKEGAPLKGPSERPFVDQECETSWGKQCLGGYETLADAARPPSALPLAGSDLLFIHGINDFGGKFSCHARMFLEAGVTILDPLRVCGTPRADADPWRRSTAWSFPTSHPTADLLAYTFTSRTLTSSVSSYALIVSLLPLMRVLPSRLGLQRPRRRDQARRVGREGSRDHRAEAQGLHRRPESRRVRRRRDLPQVRLAERHGARRRPRVPPRDLGRSAPASSPCVGCSIDLT